MSSLAHLRELQAILDHLRTIERDLSAFPPDLMALDQQLKAIRKSQGEKQKALEDARQRRETHAAELAQADKAIARVRTHLKEATQKVQYAALIREQEEHERAHNAAAKPLKEAEAQVAALERELSELAASEAAQSETIATLHGAFLAEHGNQVAVRTQLEGRRAELEASLPPTDLARFRRVFDLRQGKGVVAVENGLCTGCRTRLRPAVMPQLREAKTLVACEACQRFLFLP